jgi:hypothetical protein
MEGMPGGGMLVGGMAGALAGMLGGARGAALVTLASEISDLRQAVRESAVAAARAPAAQQYRPMRTELRERTCSCRDVIGQSS